MYRYLLMSSLLALPAAAAAQDGQTQEKTRETTLNPVVVTGTGTYHKAENSPVAVRVISKKELQEANVASIEEALTKLTPSMTTQTNGMGTFLSFNGVSDDYLLVLENGKRVAGDDRWNRISIDNIKRIEILSGAASALYGSDAIAGVVNIITDDSRTGLDASSMTKVMSKGRFSQDVNADATIGRFSSHTSYSRREADNWQVNRYQEFKEGSQSVYKLTGRPMSQAFRSDNITEKMEWNFTSQLDAYVKGGYYDYKTRRDRNAQYFTQKASTDKLTGEKTYTYTPRTAYTYDMHHATWNVGAGAKWVPTNNVHLYLDVYTDNFKSAYDYWQTANAEAYEETRKHTRYYNETLRGIFRLNRRNKLSAGVEMEQESLKSASDNIRKETTATYNIFAQDELDIIKGLTGVAGLRYTYNNNFGSQLTPNVALFYRYAGFRARLSYAEGYRTPTLSQLYATDQAKTSARYTLSNARLKAEKNRFWNLNLEYSNSWISVSLSGFCNNIRDMINYRTLTDQEIHADDHLQQLYDEGWTTIRQRDNINRARVNGMTANIKLLLPYGFTLSGGYTLCDSKAKTQTLDGKTQEYLTTESPVDKSVRNVANVMASWDKAWGAYSLNVHITGHIQGERYSSTYGYAPKYQQWDISTRHTFRLSQLTLTPGIGIENVFNKRDTSYWNSNFSTVSPGRSFYVSVALKFNSK